MRPLSIVFTKSGDEILFLIIFGVIVIELILTGVYPPTVIVL